MSENVEMDKGQSFAEPAALGSESRGMSRRTLCLGIGASAVLLGLGAVKLVPAEAKVRPPGAQDEDALLGACIRCERCLEACPHHVIKMQHMEDGFLSMRTPVLDFANDYCTACVELNEEVPRCIAVCPTDAFAIPQGIAPEKVVIGVAIIDEVQCLAFRSARCQFCFDVCPFEAIEMVSNKPRVIADLCTGCGACESVCVSHKAGSIVSGSTRRAIAVVPVSEAVK